MLRIPRLPYQPDLLRRVHVTSDLKSITTVGEEVDSAPLGVDPATIAGIWKAGCDLYRSGVHPALQLCLRLHGEVVLNRAIGHARGNGPDDDADEPKVPVTPETPFCLFSTSKAVTAMVVHLLQERGALDIADRVTDYIPEYGVHGKQDTTIGHVLAHRAGLPGLPREAFDLDRVDDREFLGKTINESKPFVKPGTALAYHAVAGGFILGEIVQRVTGKTVRDVLAQEILEPLRFRWGNYGVAMEDVDQVGINYTTGPPVLPPLSTLVTRVLGMPIEQVVELSNDPRFLTAVIPSASVITSAEELSRFFEIFRCGGEL